MEFCLWNAQDDTTNFQRNFALGEMELENGGAVIYHKTEYRERRNHYAVFAVNAAVDGYDTDRESFMGLYNGFGSPQAVLEDKPRNSEAHGWAPIGSHNIRRTLTAGRKRKLRVRARVLRKPAGPEVYRAGRDQQAAMHTRLLAAFRTVSQFNENALRIKSSTGMKLLSHFTIQIGGREVRPADQPVEPVPVHGDVQYEPLRQLL